MNIIPVISKNRQILMPTSWNRAKSLIKRGEATPFIDTGQFCIRMNKKTGTKTQPMAMGIDPGSKKEAYTIKSEKQTYLNIQCDARTGIKEKVEQRREARRNRRNRKTPCRKPRFNNRKASCKKGRIPPSTKARYDLKLNLINRLAKLYPITTIIVEDIQAITKEGKKNWNKNFSPLETGKTYFYNKLRENFHLELRSGIFTLECRKQLGLEKTKNKLAEVFEAHCVDSWVLANSVVGGHTKPDNTNITFLSVIKLHRRQLHVFVPSTGGKRKEYGGTISAGLKRGSIIKYIGKDKKQIKNGRYYLVGGKPYPGKISLHSIKDYKRLSQSIDVKDCKFIAYNKFVINKRRN